MQKSISPEDRVNLGTLRLIAVLPVAWVVFGIVLPNFLMGIFNIKNAVLESTVQGVGVILLGTCTVYLLVLVRKERWLIRLVVAGVVFLLLSVCFQFARKYHFFDDPPDYKAQNILRQFEVTLNGLGFSAMTFAFFWALIDLLYLRHSLTVEQTRLYGEMAEREQIKAALSESEARYRGLYDSVKDGIVRVTLDGFVVETNIAYREMLGYSPEELASLTYKDITPAQWHEKEAGIVRDQIYPRGYSDPYEKEYLRKDGTLFPVELRTWLFRDKTGAPVGMWALVRDITERKQARTEMEGVVAELKGALSKVRQLEGILPVCSFCKKIKDGEGRWHLMEQYIGDRSQAEFSHGLCPECAKTRYPEVFSRHKEA